LILLNIAAGCIILEERKLYSGRELLNILLCGLVSICGVWIIIKKPTTKLSSCMNLSKITNQEKTPAKSDEENPRIELST
jgi:hypothetical protein